MMESMSKEKLLAQAKAGRQSFEELLGTIEPDQMLAEALEAGWSVKDSLAHIVAWELRMIAALAEIRQGMKPTAIPYNLDDAVVDAINQQIYEENRHRSLDAVLADFERSYQEAMAAVEATPEADLIDPNRFPWREGRPLWYMVAGNMHEHYREHEESIAKWLAEG